MENHHSEKTVPGLEHLVTPSLLLDTDKVRHNISVLSKRMKSLGVPLRPHGKTPKNATVMEWAVAGQPGGLTVSTLAEAEYFFEKGFTDLTYAVGIAPNKLSRVLELTRRGARVSCILDTLEQADFVSRAASEAGENIPVLIEIDSDGHRSGLDPEDPALPALGEKIASLPGLLLDGVLTHAGESYNCKTTDEIAHMAERERNAAVAAAVSRQRARVRRDQHPRNTERPGQLGGVHATRAAE